MPSSIQVKDMLLVENRRMVCYDHIAYRVLFISLMVGDVFHDAVIRKLCLILNLGDMNLKLRKILVVLKVPPIQISNPIVWRIQEAKQFLNSR